MTGDIDKLQTRIEYRFQEQSLLQRALTHRSAQQPNNERLEFLGDAVLGMVVADYLIARFPDASEGELSKMRAMIVNNEVLAQAGRELDVGACIKLGAGERKNKGNERDSILSGAVEALIAALYLAGGLDVSRKFVERHIIKYLAKDSRAGSQKQIKAKRKLPSQSKGLGKDAKTELQEYMQAKHKPLPRYRVVEVKGAPHKQMFRATCKVEPLAKPVVGQGLSKQAAEKDAAQQALTQILQQKQPKKPL
ncbi:MAG: ribonuclease III [Pseudohongiellaceae bacterium]